jgi:hypothetical protein
MCTCASTAVATSTDGSVTLTTWYPENKTADVDDYTDWVEYETLELNVGDSATSLGMKIKVSEISTSGKVVMLVINNEALAMKADDEEVYESKKVKISMDEINADGSSGNSDDETTDEDGGYVTVYVELPDGTQKKLTRNGDNPDKLNLANYDTDEWWDTGASNDEISIFVKRIDSSASINLKSPVSDGAWSRENNYNDNTNLVKFTLKDNEVYTFSVEYETEGSWGSTQTETDSYAISISGLGTSGSSSSSSSSSDSEDSELLSSTTKSGKVEKDITYYTTVDGEWEADPTAYDITGTEVDGKYKWVFYFYETGNYPIKFTSKGGESGTVTFKITEETTAAQTTTTTNTTAASSSKLVFVIAALALIGIVFVMKGKKGGGGGRGGSRGTYEEVGGQIG